MRITFKLSRQCWFRNSFVKFMCGVLMWSSCVRSSCLKLLWEVLVGSSYVKFLFEIPVWSGLGGGTWSLWFTAHRLKWPARDKGREKECFNLQRSALSENRFDWFALIRGWEQSGNIHENFSLIDTVNLICKLKDVIHRGAESVLSIISALTCTVVLHRRAWGARVIESRYAGLQGSSRMFHIVIQSILCICILHHDTSHRLHYTNLAPVTLPAAGIQWTLRLVNSVYCLLISI